MNVGDDFEIYGSTVDAMGRCRHYHSELDILAIKFPCCGKFYACFECHATAVDHEPVRWRADQFEEIALMCGKCRNTFTIRLYLEAPNACPYCTASFNPACSNHHSLYFEVSS